jgi:hypothetical protein
MQLGSQRLSFHNSEIVHGTVDHHMADLLLPHRLWLRGKAQVGIDPPLRQDDNGVSRLQPEEEWRREVPIEVGFTGGERRLNIGGPHSLEVVHFGEPFTAQQFFGHILGGLADARDLDEALI